MISSENILITGANGFIGSSLLRFLQKNPPRGKIIGVDLPSLDLADSAAVYAFLRDCAPSRIVHLAASLERRENESGRIQQWRNTFEGGRNLIEAASVLKVPHLLIAGTVDELGDQGGMLFPELPARPRTTYGLCKSLLREVAQFQTRKEVLRLDWFRPFTVYGPGQLGSMLIPYACRMARDGMPAEFTDGRQIRDFLYVDDLLSWLALALQIDLSGVRQGEFHLHHLGSQEGASVSRILELIGAEFPRARFRLGVKPRRLHEPEVQIAPPYSSSASPLQGWIPRVSLHEGISRTARWWKSIE